MESQTNTHSENPHLEREIKNSEELSLQIILTIKEKLDCCYDKNGPAAQIGSEPLWNAIAQLKYKGTKLRLITEITKENITYCKTMMRYFDVRHMDGVKGNFAILDRVGYLGNMLIFDDSKPRVNPIHINNESFVGLQQYIFDTLWDMAIPSREKIKEIELGLDKEFVETMKEPAEIQNLINNLLKSATYEVLILFSTLNSFYRAKQENILEILKESVDRGVNVRLLVPTEDVIKEMPAKKLKDRRKQIYIQYISKPLQTNIITLIIDQTISLSVDIRDDTKETFKESIGLATYSNMESNVSSCASVFETLWIHSELDKQNKIKKSYFDVFTRSELKDETYDRKWYEERQ